MRCLMWFREDLRVSDNTALYHASKAANQNGLLAVYIISPQDWHAHDTAACRVDFILRTLTSLRTQLSSVNIPLLILQTKTSKTIPTLLLNLIQQHKIDTLYFNEQYEINEARRDMAVERLLKQNGVKIFSYADQTIVPPGEILTKTGNYYTVFTPFKKTWLKAVGTGKIVVLPSPLKQIKLAIKADPIPRYKSKSTIPVILWPAGEQSAQQKLSEFIQHKIKFYDKQRDFPAMDGTSKLSPYLSVGILSARQCLKAALEVNEQRFVEGNTGVTTWINELIWREFYKHVLQGFPRVSMNKAFKIATENMPWNNDQRLFTAWCEGRTGYPIVDAAMRQLAQMGWMHNRLRMVVAMFLVKDLLIDWRWGEKFFMQHLIDGDLAANNGGWQWAASTGTDAVPYFRVFNPTSQSKRFDPNGDFIRHYCPELAQLDNKAIHEPYKLARKAIKALAYPRPIVEHKQARKRFLKIFKKMNQI